MTPVKYVRPSGPHPGFTGSLEFMKAIAIWTKATMPKTIETDEIRVAKLFGLEALPIFLYDCSVEIDVSSIVQHSPKEIFV